MFPLYLWYLLTNFRQTFVTGASWVTDDRITFLGQKVKVQGHTIAVEAHSTRRYRRVQLFLVNVVLIRGVPVDVHLPLYVDVAVLQIDGDLVKPTMRAAVEEQLNLIAHGKADFNAVLEHTLSTFTAKFKYFVEHIQAMDELFEVSFSPLASSGRPISR